MTTFSSDFAGTSISLAPLIDLVGQLAVAAVSAGVVALLPKVAAMLHLKFTDQQWAIIDRTAEHWAKQMWAASEPSIAGVKFNVGDEEVAKLAKRALDDIPGVLKNLGLTGPEAQQKMEQYILAKLGGLQAGAKHAAG